jgi:proteasome lid subunit RPN8/RPN11
VNDAIAELYAQNLAGAIWRKASGSGPEHNCVEVAELPEGARAVRDSKNPEREPLRFTAAEWAAFRQGVISGEL